MKSARVDVARIRREQIVEAAVAVISEQGLQNLSLSKVEQKAGMSRGQLTYYFPSWDAILLAVFDRLLELLHQRMQAANGGPCGGTEGGWERLQHFLKVFLLQPPAIPEFHALQYTFLSQIGHREDFRVRLASLYDEWRSHLAADVADELTQKPGGGGNAVSARTFASFVQALLHGLAMQRAADPDAYDRQEMLELCLDVLGTYLRPRETPPSPSTFSPKTPTTKASPDIPVLADGSLARPEVLADESLEVSHE
jgi:AcrR family transcriptional regulator